MVDESVIMAFAAQGTAFKRVSPAAPAAPPADADAIDRRHFALARQRAAGDAVEAKRCAEFVKPPGWDQASPMARQAYLHGWRREQGKRR